MVVAPDHRVWTHLRSDQPLSVTAFKTMIEREYPSPDPQFSGGLLLLAEPPSSEAPHGRIWFELIHKPIHRSFGPPSDDKPWAMLLGYSGVPGSWIQREATEPWDFGDPQVFSWWNTCISRTDRRRHSMALAGREFFVHGGDVDCFNGYSWTSQAIGRGRDNRYPVELLPEPDGKGFVVLHPEAPPSPTWTDPGIHPEHVWRWRDGDWHDVALPQPLEWHTCDRRPVMGVGGMWVCSRDGLWFAPFDGAAPPVVTPGLGQFAWEYGFAETDEEGRLCVRSSAIWKVDEPAPPPADQSLKDGSKRPIAQPAHHAPHRAAGVVIREPDGACRFSPGDFQQPFGTQAQLPDLHFSIVDLDGQRIYAGWNTGMSNLCLQPPIMLYTPAAPDNVIQLKHLKKLSLNITEAGFVIDDAGGVIAQEFQHDIVRFNGQDWQPIDALHGVSARALAAGHDGVLVVLAGDNTWRLVSAQSARTYDSLEQLIEKNRELIATAYSRIRLTGYECLKLSISVDFDKNIWICCPTAGLAKVLTANAWQEVMAVSPSDGAMIAAFSSYVYADRSGRVSDDAHGKLARVRNGAIESTRAPDNAVHGPFAFGPLTAADGSLWVSETDNGNLIGAVRIDPTGAFQRFAHMRPRCADASGAVFLSAPGFGFSAITELRVWQSGNPLAPLPDRRDGYWMARVPPMFADAPGSIWLFSNAGLQHVHGEGSTPLTFKLDDSIWVLHGAARFPPDDPSTSDGWDVIDFEAAGLSKLGYFILLRNNEWQLGGPHPTPNFSLRLVPIPGSFVVRR